eukprot:CAMPEP_0178386784 /NCGR_PEP_ID=MMETSP0689_2-20121128/8739_1 /TAXON_ID=160604 /ORGANISM="Amphidinium massartii, Strain CS-259" /LENGTH=39 /DNA_ID= /DNA_START= /DNA_END= /DNA_ORIENTATION=
MTKAFVYDGAVTTQLEPGLEGSDGGTTSGDDGDSMDIDM